MKRVLILVVPCLAAFVLSASLASGATLVRSSLSAKVTPKADLKGPRVFRVKGTMTPASTPLKCAAGVTNPKYCTPATRAEICVGKVRITVKRGLLTLARGTVSLKSNCTYSAKITIKASRVRTHARLGVTARFLGNTLVAASNSKRVTVRV